MAKKVKFKSKSAKKSKSKRLDRKDSKSNLLSEIPTILPRDFDEATALNWLKKSDPVMKAHITKVGQYKLVPHHRTVYETLSRAIIFQQLSGKAAETIYGRMVLLAPSPEVLRSLSVQQLRTAGVSRSKALALLDLSEKHLSGALPSMEDLERMTDEKVIEALTFVRGIGPWTAQMFLMFRMHRTDVLPVTDLGILKGFARVYKKRGLPGASILEKHAEKWRPYRTVACWYLWRALDT